MSNAKLKSYEVYITIGVEWDNYKKFMSIDWFMSKYIKIKNMIRLKYD